MTPGRRDGGRWGCGMPGGMKEKGMGGRGGCRKAVQKQHRAGLGHRGGSKWVSSPWGQFKPGGEKLGHRHFLPRKDSAVLRTK